MNGTILGGQRHGRHHHGQWHHHSRKFARHTVGGNYTLQLSGLLCPPPTLNIQPVTTNQARLYWPTWVGGYLLEATTSLAPTNWTIITNEPIVSSLKYNVTNSTISPTNRFYRLHQP